MGDTSSRLLNFLIAMYSVIVKSWLTGICSFVERLNDGKSLESFKSSDRPDRKSDELNEMRPASMYPSFLVAAFSSTKLPL